jgi:hypothetical protein
LPEDQAIDPRQGRTRPKSNFSDARDKEEMSRDVDDHFAIGEILALGIPVSVLGLLSRGIKEFSRKHGSLCIRALGTFPTIFGLFRDDIDPEL